MIVIKVFFGGFPTLPECRVVMVVLLYTLRNEVGRTHRWLVHTKFLAHLAVFAWFVHHLVYRAHQFEEIQHTSCSQVCTNHH